MAPEISRRPDRIHAASGIPEAAIAAELSRILASAAFQKSKRLARFLSFAVERTLTGDEAALKETVLGMEVCERGPDFDPRIDPIVRMDARRLRARVGEYYQGPGAPDPVRIEFEPGSYVPNFRTFDAAVGGPRVQKPIHAPRPIRNVLALDMLRRARKELEDVPSVEGVLKAIRLFERAAATNPDHALAHLGIALCSIWMAQLACESPHSAMPRAKAAAQRAQELEPEITEPHVALAVISAFYDYDVRAANASLRLAGRIRPQTPFVQQCYATCCLAPAGNLAEAAATIEAVIRAEPLARFRFSLGWIRYLQRDWAAAVEQLQATLAAAPHFVPAQYFLAMSYERQGQYDLADRALDTKAARIAFPLLEHRGNALRSWREGRTDEAIAAARRMEAEYTAGSNDPMLIAEVFAAVGETASAIEWLNRAYEDRRSWLLYLKSDPAYDSIRSDAGFRELVSRMGLSA